MKFIAVVIIGNWFLGFEQDNIFYNNLETYEPKWVNPVLNTIGVNSLRIGGLQFIASDSIYITYYDSLKNSNRFFWLIKRN